tara:strand:+ start:41803 stop:43035 length:1233 start_codon:yes stop_codon:yes gene_type:complete
MQQHEHWDLLLSNQVDKKAFIETILNGTSIGKLSHFNTKSGMLFSDIAIANFIKKEYQYDSIEAATETTRKLSSFSSGERKKVFLNYCIKQEPDYIILDNPLDHLDINSRKSITIALEELAKKVQLIQIVNRNTDLQNFILNKAHIRNNSFVLEDLNPVEETTTTYFKTIPNAFDPILYQDTVLIQMNGVNVSYFEKPILKAINWTIKKGEFWHLLGPNGSGKSTLLSLITGENAKGYGQDVSLFGKKKGSGESIWDIKKNIGYFSTAMLDLFLKRDTLEQMILSGFFDSIGLYSQPNNLQKKLVTQWLELINMNHLKNSIFNQLSIGQQRLALIVRAVLKHPPLLILDEPLEGLDDENATLVTQLITLLSQKTDMAILYVSHRSEPNLKPNAIYELTPQTTGSTGEIKK